MFFQSSKKIPRRKLALVTADVMVILFAIVVSALLRLEWDLGWAYIAEHVPSLLGSTGIFLLVFYAGGMYEREPLTRKNQPFLLPLIASLVGLILVVLVFYSRMQFYIGRGILLQSTLFIFLELGVFDLCIV